MGVSTDAIHAFGIPLTEDEAAEHSAWIDDLVELWSDEDQQNYGVALVEHCSDEYQMFFLAVPGTVTTAARGTPRKLDAAVVAGTEAYLKRIHQMGLQDVLKDRLGWYIMSYWG